MVVSGHSHATQSRISPLHHYDAAAKCHRQFAYGTALTFTLQDLLIGITEWLGATHYGNQAQTTLALPHKWLLNANLPSKIFRA